MTGVTVTAIEPGASRVTLDDGRSARLRPAAAHDRRRAAPAAYSRARTSTASATCARSPTATCCGRGSAGGGHVVVVGAGWIGSEFAASARQRGLRSPSSTHWRCRTSGSSAPRSAPSTGMCTSSTVSTMVLGDGVGSFGATARSSGSGPPAAGRSSATSWSLASAWCRGPGWRRRRAGREQRHRGGRRAADLRAGHLRGGRRGERLAPVLPAAGPGRALGERAAPGTRRGPGDAR